MNLLERIFHANPRNIKSHIINQLEALGIVVEKEGGHYKIFVRGDEGIKVTMASTPGEARSGKNTAGEIIKRLL